MNCETANGTWKKIEGKIKKKWGKLTDDDVQALKGNLEDLVGMLQTVYGYAKDKAETEYEDFKGSLGTVVGEVKGNKMFAALSTLTIVGLLSIVSVITANFVRKKN